MILDDVLSYDIKVQIAVACAALWIYFRTSDCYNMIPRKHVFPVLFVAAWTYANYYEPLCLPLGLSLLVAYAYLPLSLPSFVGGHRSP